MVTKIPLQRTVIGGKQSGRRKELEITTCVRFLLRRNRRLHSDSPTLHWSEIQKQLELENTECDILLILDCCYAGQALRGGKTRHNIQLLAAAGMNEKTLAPGPGSFTEAFMSLCSAILESGESQGVSISTLHRRMSHKSVGLRTTPFIGNITGSDIVLNPLHVPMIAEELAVSTLHLSLDMRSLCERDFEDLALWLGRNVPRSVSRISVEEIVDVTRQAYNMVTMIRADAATSPDESNTTQEKDLFGIWKHMQTLVNQILRSGSLKDPQDINLLREQAQNLLEQLDIANDEFAAVLTSDATEFPGKQGGYLGATSATYSIERLSQSRIRRQLQLPQVSHGSALVVGQENRPTYSEYRYYDQHMCAEDLEKARKGFERLVEVLSVEKPEAFHSLRLDSHGHEPEKNRFVLNFHFPQGYETSEVVTLQTLIASQETDNSPTLQQRLQMASVIAAAMRNWHLGNWLHQSISSRDIVFFRRRDSPRCDFATPFLGGFEYSRPVNAPSVGRYVQNPTTDIYRHPDRLLNTQRHTKRHDLYSLGVVLLEIGLWKLASDIVQADRTPMVHEMVTALRNAAKEKLALYIGTSFRDATLYCLELDSAVDEAGEDTRKLDQAFKFRVVDKLKETIDPQCLLEELEEDEDTWDHSQ